jgi:antitoxin YefM
MATKTTYTEARANLADLLARAPDDRETVIITRRGAADVALIAADELAGLLETAHLLRSPANATRLLTALKRAVAREGTPQTLAELRREIGLDAEVQMWCYPSSEALPLDCHIGWRSTRTHGLY